MISSQLSDENKQAIRSLSNVRMNFATPDKYSSPYGEFEVEIVRNKKPDHYIDAFRVPHTHDFDYLNKSAQTWKDDDLIGINAENVNYYKKTFHFY